MKLVNEILEFALYFSMLALMWVGAEWVFEGAVHASAVDTVICAAFARVVQRS